MQSATPRRSWTKPEIVGIVPAKDAKNGGASNNVDHVNPLTTAFDPNYTGPS